MLLPIKLLKSLFERLFCVLSREKVRKVLVSSPEIVYNVVYACCGAKIEGGTGRKIHTKGDLPWESIAR